MSVGLVQEIGVRPHDLCSICEEVAHVRYQLWLRIEPGRAPQDPLTDYDGVDWHDYYWRYTSARRHSRRHIVRPLPRHLTDRIPSEIIDYIIERLTGNQQDLYNCALVCHAWYHSSMSVLYAHIDVMNLHNYLAFAQCALQGVQSRRYLSTTQELHIEGMRSAAEEGLKKMKRSTPGLPLVFGNLMPHLRCLTLQTSLSPPYHPSFITCMSAFKELQHLSLREFVLSSFADLRRLILALPGLRHLNLFLGWLVPGAGTPTIYNSSGNARITVPRLSTLAIEGVGQRLMYGLIEWLASTSICLHLDELLLSIGEPVTSKPASVDSFLRVAASSLRVLRLWTIGLDYVAPLAYATNVRHLNLEIHLSLDSAPTRKIFRALEGIILQISSDQLRTLSILMRFTPADDSQTFDSRTWLEDDPTGYGDPVSIHNAIAQPAFSTVQCVDIELSIPGRAVLGLQGPGEEDTVLEELCSRVRRVLEPWDLRSNVLRVNYGFTSAPSDTDSDVATDSDVRRTE